MLSRFDSFCVHDDGAIYTSCKCQIDIIIAIAMGLVRHSVVVVQEIRILNEQGGVAAIEVMFTPFRVPCNISVAQQ